MKFYSRYRRNFILLEILIAFFLVALCVFPLVQSQFSILKSEKELNKTLHFHSDSNALFCDVVEKLYKKEISPINGPLVFENGKVEFDFTKRKESDSASFYILKTTIIDLNQRQNHYYLFIKGKGTLSSQSIEAF